MNLPPLPEPDGVIVVGTQARRAFTADSVEAYAAEAVRVALEDAARLTLAVGIECCDSYGDGAECIATSERCADAIRALAAPQSPPADRAEP